MYGNSLERSWNFPLGFSAVESLECGETLSPDPNPPQQRVAHTSPRRWSVPSVRPARRMGDEVTAGFLARGSSPLPGLPRRNVQWPTGGRSSPLTVAGAAAALVPDWRGPHRIPFELPRRGSTVRAECRRGPADRASGIKAKRAFRTDYKEEILRPPRAGGANSCCAIACTAARTLAT